MKRLLFVLSALLLAGCVPLLKSPGPSRVFNLTAPKPAVATESARLPIQLSVDELAAGGALESNRIVVYAKPLELQYLAGAQWSERSTRLWQRLMVETIESSGRFRAVSSSGQALKADWNLLGELIEFQAHIGADGAAQIRVRLSLKLVENPSLKVREQRTFQARIDAPRSDPDSIIAAFEQATRQVLTDLALWVGSQT